MVVCVLRRQVPVLWEAWSYLTGLRVKDDQSQRWAQDRNANKEPPSANK